MDLLGWDTVSTVSIPWVNRALAERVVPLDFEFSGDDFDAPSFTCRGRLGTWSVVGGSGDLLYVSVGLSGQISTSAASLALDGAAAVFAISLQLLPPDAAQLRALTCDLSNAGVLIDMPGPGLVTPLTLTGPPEFMKELGDVGQEALLNGLAQTLSAHAGELSYVLANVSLVPPGGNGWLAPAESAYCFYPSPHGSGQGYLAVLGVTTPRDVRRLSRTIPPELLAGNPDAALAISRDLVLAHVIMPTL
ncbi:MAG TPA: TULIP family P47-like protein, partial [Longimicrobium sp.]|nr:TULIP family P47-like protein [Longimicrobium sp.]